MLSCPYLITLSAANFFPVIDSVLQPSVKRETKRGVHEAALCDLQFVFLDVMSPFGPLTR